VLGGAFEHGDMPDVWIAVALAFGRLGSTSPRHQADGHQVVGDADNDPRAELRWVLTRQDVDNHSDARLALHGSVWPLGPHRLLLAGVRPGVGVPVGVCPFHLREERRQIEPG
jgi:hypothetical protein